MNKQTRRLINVEMIVKKYINIRTLHTLNLG